MTQYIEILLILGLIAWQFFVFLTNRRLIARVQVMYPDVTQLGVQAVDANAELRYTDSYVPQEYDALTVGQASPEFARIITDTNDYLRANKGAAADFNTLRDISEREAALLDQEIEVQISTPLYLGLLGTFLGAILGLFSLLYSPNQFNAEQIGYIRQRLMSDVVSATKPVASEVLNDSASFNKTFSENADIRQKTHSILLRYNYPDIPKNFEQFEQSITEKASFDNEAINHFLLGILIAMSGSFTGLLLTLGGNQLLKSARAQRDRFKNSYYNFLQKALLPRLNSDMQASMSNLKAVLDTFNNDFFSKIQADFFSKIAEFTPLISSITENVSVQKNFLEKLQQIGYTELANATIKVFDRVDESAASFEKFLGYQQALNVSVSKGADTAQTITALLDRLSSLEQALKQVPGYLQQHDARIREQAQFFGQHQALLSQISQGVTQALSEDAHKMNEVLEKRRDEFVAQAQSAHAQWDAYFRQLNKDNVYQKIVEYLNPFQQLPAQQQALNQLQETQARRSAEALQGLQQRLERDEQVQRELLRQLRRTNAVLEQLTEPSWFQRTVLGKKGRPTR